MTETQKRRGRPKGSKAAPLEFDRQHFKGWRIERIHKFYEEKGGTRSLAEWKNLYADNRARIRTALIKAINGKTPRAPTIDGVSHRVRSFADKEQYDRSDFKRMHLEGIHKIYRDKTGSTKSLQEFLNEYGNSRTRVRTALIKCINGKPPRAPKIKILSPKWNKPKPPPPPPPPPPEPEAAPKKKPGRPKGSGKKSSRSKSKSRYRPMRS